MRLEPIVAAVCLLSVSLSSAAGGQFTKHFQASHEHEDRIEKARLVTIATEVLQDEGYDLEIQDRIGRDCFSRSIEASWFRTMIDAEIRDLNSQPLGRSWDDLASLGPLRSVIDAKDTLGHKNLFIDQLHKRALREAIEGPLSNILDYGCGSGRMLPLTTLLCDYTVGLDSALNLLRLHKDCNTGPFSSVKYDGRSFPFGDESFSAALSVWTIQYLLDDQGFKHTINEIRRCLKPGAQLFILEQGSLIENTWQRKKGEYLELFSQCGYRTIDHYPIRNGRSMFQYAIRYGLIPRKFFGKLVKHEMERAKRNSSSWCKYQDFIFVFAKEG